VLRALLSGSIAMTGVIALSIAVLNERRMQGHRQPGVSYRDVTLRKDGGWRRTDLFTAEGLRLQRRASAFGVTGAAFLLAALGIWVLLS
jgi:hypothetical protein